MKRRVVITGMGAVSPIGNTVDEMWQGIREKRCGIDEITHFDTSDYKVKLAAEVKDLDMERYFSKRDLKFNDRFTQFARIAAKQAMEDSKINTETENMDRFGVIIGSGIGGIATIEQAQVNLETRGAGRVSPFFIPMTLANLAAGTVAIDIGARRAQPAAMPSARLSIRSATVMKISSWPAEARQPLRRWQLPDFSPCELCAKAMTKTAPAFLLTKNVTALSWEKVPAS